MDRVSQIVSHLKPQEEAVTSLVPITVADKKKKKRLPRFGTDFNGSNKSDAEKAQEQIDRYSTILGNAFLDNGSRLSMTTMMKEIGVPALEDSYRIQFRAIDQAKTKNPALKQVGWKLGPRFFGPIFDHTCIRTPRQGETVKFSIGGRNMRGVEGETAFQLARDFPAGASYTLEEVAAGCGDLAVSIEILATRYDGEGRWTLSMITSDLGHGVGVALGVPCSTWRTDLDLAKLTATTFLNGEEVMTGGTEKLVNGGPINALHWHVNNFSKQGITLQKGMWISTGSVTGLSADVKVGDVAKTDWGPVLGSVTVEFVE